MLDYDKLRRKATNFGVSKGFRDSTGLDDFVQDYLLKCFENVKKGITHTKIEWFYSNHLRAKTGDKRSPHYDVRKNIAFASTNLVPIAGSEEMYDLSDTNSFNDYVSCHDKDLFDSNIDTVRSFRDKSFLSEREKKILCFVLEGNTNKEIAKEFGLREHYYAKRLIERIERKICFFSILEEMHG